MKNTLPAKIAGLGVSAVTVVLAVAAPLANADPWYSHSRPCQIPGYELTKQYPDFRSPLACTHPSVAAGVEPFKYVNQVSIRIPPPEPGQPLRPNVSFDPSLPPCFQVDPAWSCAVPWVPA